MQSCSYFQSSPIFITTLNLKSKWTQEQKKIVELEQGVKLEKAVKLEEGVKLELGVKLEQGVKLQQGVKLAQGVKQSVHLEQSVKKVEQDPILLLTFPLQLTRASRKKGFKLLFA